MSISTHSSSFMMTSTNFRTDDITLMSTCLQTTFEFPVSCTILSLASSAFSGFRQARITLPLLSARQRAVSNPIPYQWTEGRKQNVMKIKYFSMPSIYYMSAHFVIWFSFFVLFKRSRTLLKHKTDNRRRVYHWLTCWSWSCETDPRSTCALKKDSFLSSGTL